MATTYFLGSQVPLGVTITDATGTPADATAVNLTITLPDGTTATPSVNHSGTGLYDVDYTPSQAGRHTLFWVATGTNASSYSELFLTKELSTLPVLINFSLKILSLSEYPDDEQIK